MKTKTRLTLSLSAALLLVNPAHADDGFPPPPSVCPNVIALQAVGVSQNVVQDNQRLWYTGRRNQKYATPNNWTFIIGKIPAANTSEAYTKAVIGMNTLSFQLGPFMGPIGKWICLYNTAEAYTAVTVYPPIATFKNADHFLTR